MRSWSIFFALFLGLVSFGLAMGLEGCDSNSGSSALTCGAACVDANSGLSRNYNIQSKSPTSESACDQTLQEVIDKSSDYNEPVCANNLVMTPSSGGCDVAGTLFIVHFTRAVIGCTIDGPGPLPSCIRERFRDEEWDSFGNCLECGVDSLANFGSCVNAPTPLLTEDVSQCVGAYVTTLNECTP
ncbi:MAG: hypothetical protein P8M78_09945 [Myxococcota bacterium]|nr:hypothetical protein [Myxococcota bacterium]